MKLKTFSISLLIVFLCPFLVACGVKGKVSLNVTGTPLKISVDTNGNLSFNVDSGIKIPTPLGVVEAGLVVEPSEFFRDQNPEGILTVRLNGNDYFYDLNGHDFDLKFESGYYKQVNLRKTGSNLFLELIKLEANSEPQVVVIVVTSTAVEVGATPVLTISASRPARINIVKGGNHPIPSGDWTWVCTGDFSITLADGTKKALYDVGVSNTGLTLILQPNGSFTIDGPFDMNQGIAVGDCYPYSQSEKDSAISNAISAQLNQGCGSQCQYVNVIELDQDGNEVSNYWTPEQP